MPFKVISEVPVDLLIKVGEYRDAQGNLINYDHVSRVYYHDDIVEDALNEGEELSPVVVEDYEKGKERIRRLIVKVDSKGKPVDESPEPMKAEEPEMVTSGSGDPAAKRPKASSSAPSTKAEQARGTTATRKPSKSE